VDRPETPLSSVVSGAWRKSAVDYRSHVRRRTEAMSVGDEAARLLAMPESDLRPRLHEIRRLDAELTVRLRVLEESPPCPHITTDTRVASFTDADPDPSFAVVRDMADGDIMALAFIVMMEAAKSAQDDLAAIMESVKAINKSKEALRDEIAKREREHGDPSADTEQPHARGDLDAVVEVLLTLTAADIERQAEGVLRDLDSMSEMGEMESLRLQMAMDRLSKMISTLSNLLKKIADTNQQITQNLK
jgi:hypothetical protein